ncbi:lysophospholipid acyltransferase family protein [Ottowia sp.]|uniref:lysophospholipid acyltransferase family protein n=1 Tax=Ottowia sp. TaxID=1898956 RepID=UPI002622486C|nr:lysophospholipid acyltransferase family protein [Ottowia sp.]
MNSLRALRLLLRGGAHMARGWWTIRTRFPALTQREREARVQAWAAEFLRLWGIGLEVHGTPPAHGPLLLVANHISWLDILVLHAAGFCRFVSKAQVRHWPLIGPLASGAGTLYIERESRRDAMRVVHHMAESLGRGEVLAVFPEGTTSDGSGVLPFHANLLQAAISAGAPAQPVALRFVDAVTRAPSLAPIYIGDDSLVASVWRTLTARGVTAVVRYGAPQAADGRGRREWSADLRQAVGELMSD